LGGNLGGKVAGAAGILGNLLGTPPATATNAPATKGNPLLNTNTVNALIPTNSPAKAIEGLLRGFGKPKN
jgi:hypothetical protein